MTGPRPTRRPWTARETTWLKKNYPELGGKECARQLGRSRASVQAAAARIGAANRQHRKYQTTDRIDRRIREVYENGVGRGNLQALAEEVDRPGWWLERRAREIGAKPLRGGDRSPWSEEEEELLYATAGLSPAAAAARFRREGYCRSERAIQLRRWHLRVQPEDGGWYGVPQVAELMGCGEQTVRGWIRRGLLRAQDVGHNATHKDGSCRVYRIKDQALAVFLSSHPMEWDMRKVADQVWLVDLLTNGG